VPRREKADRRCGPVRGNMTIPKEKKRLPKKGKGSFCWRSLSGPEKKKLEKFGPKKKKEGGGQSLSRAGGKMKRRSWSARPGGREESFICLPAARNKKKKVGAGSGSGAGEKKGGQRGFPSRSWGGTREKKMPNFRARYVEKRGEKKCLFPRSGFQRVENDLFQGGGEKKEKRGPAPPDFLASTPKGGKRGRLSAPAGNKKRKKKKASRHVRRPKRKKKKIRRMISLPFREKREGGGPFGDLPFPTATEKKKARREGCSLSRAKSQQKKEKRRGDGRVILVCQSSHGKKEKKEKTPPRAGELLQDLPGKKKKKGKPERALRSPPGQPEKKKKERSQPKQPATKKEKKKKKKKKEGKRGCPGKYRALRFKEKRGKEKVKKSPAIVPGKKSQAFLTLKPNRGKREKKKKGGWFCPAGRKKKKEKRGCLFLPSARTQKKEEKESGTVLRTGNRHRVRGRGKNPFARNADKLGERKRKKKT